MIDVIGAGGIGCAVGYQLLANGVGVRFIETDPAKIESGRQHGVRVNDRPGLPAEFLPFAEYRSTPGSTVLLCVKCYDNAAVLERMPEGIDLIPIQNGFDPELDARAHGGEGIASFVSECEPHRPHARITRPGELHLGGRGHGGTIPQRLAELLRPAGLFRVVTVADIHPFKFTKLMYNAAIAPLAAAAGYDNGDLLTVREARRLFFALIRENFRILGDAGIPLAKIGPFHPRTVNRILGQPWLARMMAWRFAPSLRGTYCSMAKDLPGPRTEIDYYNGHLIRVAGERTPCPMNRAVVGLIHGMERGGTTPHAGLLGRIKTTDHTDHTDKDRLISSV